MHVHLVCSNNVVIVQSTTMTVFLKHDFLGGHDIIRITYSSTHQCTCTRLRKFVTGFQKTHTLKIDWLTERECVCVCVQLCTDVY
jgi:hypothetical protein